jgi:hypothetical protein
MLEVSTEYPSQRSVQSESQVIVTESMHTVKIA